MKNPLDEKIMQDIHQRISEAEDGMSDFRDSLKIMYKKRYGIRGKKNHPFPNCHNYSLRFADKVINRQKPMYYAVVAGLNGEKTDLMYSENMTEEEYMATKDFMNDTLNVKMNGYEEKMMIAWDKAATFNWCVVTPFIERRSEYQDIDIVFSELLGDNMQMILSLISLGPDGNFVENIPGNLGVAISLLAESMAEMNQVLDINKDDEKDVLLTLLRDLLSGKEESKFGSWVVVSKRPDIRVVDPADFIVPTHTKDLRDADLICEKMYMTEQQIRQAAIDGIFDPEVAMEVIESGSTDGTGSGDPSILYEKETREKLNYTQRKDTFEIRKVCLWLEDGKDIFRRAIVCYATNLPERWLSFYWYDYCEWPYVQFFLEKNDESFFSPRGLVSQNDTPQILIDSHANTMMDEHLIRNTPMLVYKGLSTSVSQNIRYIPSQVVRIKPDEDINAIPLGQSQQLASQNIIAFLRSYAEEAQATPDFALGNTPAQEGRTKFEIQSIVGNSDYQMAFKTKVWARCLERLYPLIYRLWYDEVKKDQFVLVNNKPVPVNRLSVNPTFRITIPYDMVNPATKKQNDIALLQLFGNDPYINAYNLRKFIIDDYGKRYQSILKPEGQVEQEQQMAAAMQIKMKQEELDANYKTQTDIAKLNNQGKIQDRVADSLLQDEAPVKQSKTKPRNQS